VTHISSKIAPLPSWPNTNRLPQMLKATAVPEKLFLGSVSAWGEFIVWSLDLHPEDQL
jgi:hypothetical protein